MVEGACRRCGKDACTTSMRMVAVKNRFPCVDCKLELSTPAVCDPAAVPEADPACLPRGRLRASVRNSVSVLRRRCCRLIKNSLSALAKYEVVS